MMQPIDQMVTVVSNMVEKCDPYTWGHQERVAVLATAIGTHLKLTEKALKYLQLGAVIHDLGKIAIPAQILNKPGRLNAAEFAMIKEHTSTGFDIIQRVEALKPVNEIVHQHHERMDGSGYPRGLTAHQITPEARIIAVADVVEAITSHRPYRPARDLQEAIEEVENNSGRLYDCDVVQAFLSLWHKGSLILDGWKTR